MIRQTADPTAPIRIAAGDGLFVVDVQNDFLPGGALAVPGADRDVPVLNRYLDLFAERSLPFFATRDWLRVVARVNPPTYEVESLRALMLAGGTSVFGLGADFAILSATTTILVLLGARIYLIVVRRPVNQTARRGRLTPLAITY
jgi:hypothetical protein